MNPENDLGDVPHGRPAEEDLGAGLESQQLAATSTRVPGRQAGPLRARHGLGHLRLLHGRDRRRGGREPLATTPPSEDDNVIVRGVSGEKGALGYLGLSLLRREQGRLKALEIDGGDGCVAAQRRDGPGRPYKPLSRPLFTYVNGDAIAEKPALDPFLTFLLDNEPKLASGAKFVPMTPDQIDEAKTALEAAGLGVEE